MSHAVRADMPYPTPDNLTPDPCAAAQLSRAYATCDGEFTAVAQYLFHHFNFYNMGMTEYAATLENIAITEMMHLDLIGKALIKLGVSPVFTQNPPRLCNYFNTSGAKYSTSPQRMIMDDIASELEAIEQYKNILACLCNEQVGAIVQRIIVDEELHVKVFNELLQNLVNGV